MTNIELMNYWFENAEKDYEVMKLLCKNHKNTWCLFLGHLVIEKIIKGLYAKNNQNDPIAPKTHNLILLSQKARLKVPVELREKIQVINTFNISARYDDYKNTFDEKCTNEYTLMQVKNIEEVMKWLKSQ